MQADWQWQRVSELEKLGGGQGFPQTYDAYLKWVDNQLGRPPRSWYGFDAPEITDAYFRYEDALPEPVKENWRTYWTSWLLPDRPYNGFEVGDKTYNFAQGYIGLADAKKYQEATGDWRGNFSVYRTYVRNMGTMNFNHWSVAATLLGGKIIGSDAMMQERAARFGKFPRSNCGAGMTARRRNP